MQGLEEAEGWNQDQEGVPQNQTGRRGINRRTGDPTKLREHSGELAYEYDDEGHGVELESEVDQRVGLEDCLKLKEKDGIRKKRMRA